MNGRHITLALGGGGARGVAHLGAIEILLERGYVIDRILGVSIGSLAGAMYAFEPDIRRVQQRALEFLMSPEFQRHQRALFGTRPRPGEETTGGLFTWYHRVIDYLRANRMLDRVIRKPSLLPAGVMQEVVDHLLPEADLSEAQIPMGVVAVDLHSGQRIVLDEGPLRDAVRGSSALPGIFPPVQVGEWLLCDVGVFCSVPCDVACRDGDETIVAIDVSTGLRPLSRCETALDVMMRMDEIGESLFRELTTNRADLMIRPDVGQIEWFDFSACEQLLELGREAVRQALPEQQAA